MSGGDMTRRVARAIVLVALGLVSVMAALASFLTAMYALANQQFVVVGEGGLTVLLGVVAGLILGSLGFRLACRAWASDPRPTH